MLSAEIRKLENENEALRDTLEMMQKSLAKKEELKPKACEHCKFYMQHYIKVGTVYQKTYCGHCTHGRKKKEHQAIRANTLNLKFEREDKQ